jgi:hypothetical protein
MGDCNVLLYALLPARYIDHWYFIWNNYFVLLVIICMLLSTTKDCVRSCSSRSSIPRKINAANDLLLRIPSCLIYVHLNYEIPKLTDAR